MEFATGFSRNIGRVTSAGFAPSVQSKRISSGRYDVRVGGHRYRVTRGHSLDIHHRFWTVDRLDFNADANAWQASEVGNCRTKAQAISTAVSHYQTCRSN